MKEVKNHGGSIEYTCENCGEHFLAPPSRGRAKHICCSKHCMNELTKKLTKEKHSPNTICPVCNIPFWSKPSHLKRYKNVCCCKECSKILKSQKMTGTNNHQFGLKGRNNPTWKKDIKISNYGYRMIRVLDHPFRNHQDWVFEHRLVAEKFLLTEENSVEINGKKYLKPEYDVHHKNEDRLNNSPENLLVLLHGDHVRLHNKKNPAQRDKTTGQFMRKENTNASN